MFPGAQPIAYTYTKPCMRIHIYLIFIIDALVPISIRKQPCVTFIQALALFFQCAILFPQSDVTIWKFITC